MPVRTLSSNLWSSRSLFRCFRACATSTIASPQSWADMSIRGRGSPGLLTLAADTGTAWQLHGALTLSMCIHRSRSPCQPVQAHQAHHEYSCGLHTGAASSFRYSFWPVHTCLCSLYYHVFTHGHPGSLIQHTSPPSPVPNSPQLPQLLSQQCCHNGTTSPSVPQYRGPLPLCPSTHGGVLASLMMSRAPAHPHLTCKPAISACRSGLVDQSDVSPRSRHAAAGSLLPCTRAQSSGSGF